MNDPAAASGALTARVLAPDEARSIASAFDALDPCCDLSVASAWNDAARDVLGAAALVPIALLDADRQVVGTLTLERRRASWRTGSPRAACLTWPFAELGYDFRPRWRPSHREQLRERWLPALAQLFDDVRLELPRCAFDAVPGSRSDVPSRWIDSDGPTLWCMPAVASPTAWANGLAGRHRRDLGYYQRRIDRAGSDVRFWEHGGDDDLGPALDVAFALHAARVGQKRQRSGYLEDRHRRFLYALAARLPRNALRLTILTIDGSDVASCLSFVYGRRYQAYMPGWDPRFHQLDLGRQIIAHQVRCELERGGVDELSLLGGDLAYKRELGFTPRPTASLVRTPSTAAELRERLAHGVLGAARALRRSWRGDTQKPRTPSEVTP